ncbi:hypothetical protein AQUCO_03400408v1 [Aquilegia coerulea]|uniref:C2H2-type domain-containing protein n=1 Tax=Aquilegia coerulea TaxID=218851 RepID=A0A2G5CYZ1_AQUCA|nr:hypothetical protein AQUCO_03400408v1 [Aquilegia coerulea]
MESSQPEDAKSSSEDSDNKKEQLNEDAGTGRFYECVFCKRGFTTAQALGGHMNIHRRDRARNKQPTQPSVSNQPMEDFSRSGVLSPFPGHSSFFSPARESQMKSQMYFQSSESSGGQKYGYINEEMHSNKPWSLKLFEENPHTNLSLQITPTDRADKPEEKQPTEETDDVDLELRLGHDP